MIQSVFVICLLVAATTGSPAGPHIFGGQDADISDFPYVVSIAETFNGHSCGGVIISANWVITGGWCSIPVIDLAEWTVTAGSAQLDAGGSVHGVIEWISHPLMDVANGDYNFALLRVDPPFSLNVTLNIAAVTLPEQDDASPDAADAHVAGWGQAETDGEWTVGQLQYANVSVFSDDACATTLGSEYTGRKICAQDAAGAVAVCFRDAGGPLVVDDTLYGVAMYPGGCEGTQQVQLFARVASQRDWIRSTTGV